MLFWENSRANKYIIKVNNKDTGFEFTLNSSNDFQVGFRFLLSFNSYLFSFCTSWISGFFGTCLYLVLKSDYHLPKNCFICFPESPFKTIKNVFYYTLNAFYCTLCSQNIQIFVLTFWSRGRNSLIRKIKLISKSMTSRPGKQLIKIHILTNLTK